MQTDEYSALKHIRRQNDRNELEWTKKQPPAEGGHTSFFCIPFPVNGSLIPEVQTKVKQRARMVNTEFALKFTTRCKLASKCLSIKKKDT